MHRVLYFAVLALGLGSIGCDAGSDDEPDHGGICKTGVVEACTCGDRPGERICLTSGNWAECWCADAAGGSGGGGAGSAGGGGSGGTIGVGGSGGSGGHGGGTGGHGGHGGGTGGTGATGGAGTLPLDFENCTVGELGLRRGAFECSDIGGDPLWLRVCTQTDACVLPYTVCLAELNAGIPFCWYNLCGNSSTWTDIPNGGFFERCSARTGAVDASDPTTTTGTCVPWSDGDQVIGVCEAPGTRRAGGSCKPDGSRSESAMRCEQGSTCLSSAGSGTACLNAGQCGAGEYCGSAGSCEALGTCFEICNTGLVGTSAQAFAGCAGSNPICVDVTAGVPEGAVPFDLGRCAADEGAGGTGGGGGSGGGEIIPCGAVPAAGACDGSSAVRYCVDTGGPEGPHQVRVSCSGGATCAAAGNGWRICADGASCTPGESFCTGSGSMQTCDATGRWAPEFCATTCDDTPAGALCEPAGSVQLTGTLAYEVRKANAPLTGWGAVTTLPARGLLAVSYHDGEIYDAGLTDETGAFALSVPATPMAGDLVRFWALRLAEDGMTARFAVGYPGASAGEREVDAINPAETTLWFWDIPLPIASGQAWQIREVNASPAAHLFAQMHDAFAFSAATHGRAGDSLITWFGTDVDWSCGACFWPVPSTHTAWGFASQMFMPGSAGDASYWSDAVTMHELGHWAMEAYGVSPNEGGQHCLGTKAQPGLAWSEGWATFHSLDLRNSPLYYDSQDGTFFWLDFDTSQSAWGGLYTAPTSGGGLLQQQDEVWVAYAARKIARSAGVQRQAVHRALGSRGMINAPFGRGYTTHTWDVNPTTCAPINVMNTGIPAPMVADYLDALRCSGVSANVITQSVTPYPYPAQAPICP